MAIPHAVIISALLAPGLLNTPAWASDRLWALNFEIGSFFPKSKIPEVVSQPIKAWVKAMLSVTTFPRRARSHWMFQHLFPFWCARLPSGLENMLCMMSLAWWIRSTSRSVSSPTNTVYFWAADPKTVCTRSTPASPLAWWTSHAAGSSEVDNRLMNLSIVYSACSTGMLLFLFFVCSAMMEAKCTVTPFVPADLLYVWALSLVVGCLIVAIQHNNCPAILPDDILLWAHNLHW